MRNFYNCCKVRVLLKFLDGLSWYLVNIFSWIKRVKRKEIEVVNFLEKFDIFKVLVIKMRRRSGGSNKVKDYSKFKNFV